MPTVNIDWEKVVKQDEALYRLAKQALSFQESEYGRYLLSQLETLRSQSVEGVVKAVNASDGEASKSGAALVAGIDAVIGILDQPLYEAESMSNS